MSLEYVLFDLDDTIYPRNTPIMPAIGERIKIFLMENLHLTYDEASQRRTYYNYAYGTVIRGLLQEETVDIEAYLNFVHDIPVENFLHPNPQLNEMLESISIHKYIFTNSYRTHARNVLRVLGIGHFFEDIFDIQTVNFVSKPARHPYITVTHLLDTNPETCIYIDDQARNLKEPKLLGMKTILVDAEPNEWVDSTIKNITEAGLVINQFIQNESGG